MSGDIDLLLEGERRGLLPPDKIELLNEARRRGLVAGGRDAAIRDEATRRQSDPRQLDSVGYQEATAIDTMAFGATPQIAAAGRAGIKFLGDMFRGRPTSFQEDYARERDVRRAQINMVRDEYGLGTLPGDLLGGLALAPSRAAPAVAPTTSVPVIAPRAAAPPMRQLMTTSAAYGAGGAGLYGFNEETRSWADKFKNAAVHGAGGAAAGFLLPPAIAAALGVRNALVQTIRYPFSGGGRAERQAAAANEWRDLMGTEPAAATIAESPTLRWANRSLANSVTGGPIRNEVARAADDLTAATSRHVAPPGIVVDEPGAMGARIQATTRENLLDHSIPGHRLDELSDSEINRLAFHAAGENTYPTQFGARYRDAERTPLGGEYGSQEAGSLPANFVQRMPRLMPGSTNTYRLLNELGQEARQAGRLRGWKDGDFESPDFWQMVRSTYGNDVGNLLQAEFARGSTTQIPLQMRGLRDIRTDVRRAGEALEPGDPAIANYHRLQTAMTDDMQNFLTGTGTPGGSTAATMYTMADHAYRDFIQQMRTPLRSLFGDRVTPDEAFRRLTAATQTGTQNTQLLTAFYRLIREKGGRSGIDELQIARSLIMPDLRDGGRGLIAAMQNLSPEARRLMSRNSPETAQMLRGLDRYAREAEKLAPYAKAAENPRGINLTSLSNITLAATLLHHVPAALAAAGGMHLAARFMSSPRYLRWLTQVPKNVRTTDMFARHLNRLQAIAGDDAEFGQQVLEVFKGMMSSPASAGPSISPTDGRPPSRRYSGSMWEDDGPFYNRQYAPQPEIEHRPNDADPDSMSGFVIHPDYVDVFSETMGRYGTDTRARPRNRLLERR